MEYIEHIGEIIGLFIFGGFIVLCIFSFVGQKRQDGGVHNNYESKPKQLIAQPKQTTVLPEKSEPNTWTQIIEGKGLTKGGYWDTIRQKVLQRDGHRCTSCGKDYELTVDHKTPLSLGGSNSFANLTTLCKGCHENKDHRKIFNRDFDANDNYGKDPKLSHKVSVLSSALKRNSQVPIRYRDFRGKITSRTISPKRLVKDKGRIYLVAHCHLRNAERMFRVARIEI